MKRTLLLGALSSFLVAGCVTNPPAAGGPVTVVAMPSSEASQAAPQRAMSREEIEAALNDVARTNTELAASYFSYGQLKTALEVVARALQARPDYVPALSVQGLIYGEFQDFAQARVSFERALKIAPNDPDVNHNYGTILCKSGQEVQSIAYFDRALAQPTYRRPDRSHAAAGSCLFKIGRDGEAEARFASALQFNPNFPQAVYGMGEILLKKGLADRARMMMSQYERLAPATADTLWLNVRIARVLGNKDDERMYSGDLLSKFPTSEPAKILAAGG